MALARECGMTRPPTLSELPRPVLTSREEEVARLASRGLSNHAIAEELVVSVRTVETYLSHVHAKLGIASRAELAAFLEGPGAHSSGGFRPSPGGTTWALPA